MSSDSAWLGVGVGVVAGFFGLAAIENMKKTQQLAQASTATVPELKNLPSVQPTFEEQMIRKVFNLMEGDHHTEAVSYARHYQGWSRLKLKM